MLINEISSFIRRKVKQIENVFAVYTLSPTYELGTGITDLINELLPTEHHGVNIRLRDIKTHINRDLIAMMNRG